MLKKAGIIAATAAAGLVVLTPLAFASDENSVEGNQECSQEATQGGNADARQTGLVNLIGGIAAAAPVQAQIPVLNCVDASDDDFTDTDTKVKIVDNDFDFGGRH